MTTPSSRISKSVIYIPIFVLITGLSAWWLYANLSFTKMNVNVAPEPQRENPGELASQPTGLPETDCVLTARDHLGGLFRVCPVEVIQSGISAGGANCNGQFCKVLEEVKEGTKNLDEFYEMAESKDACLNAVLKSAIQHYNDVKLSRPVHALFYDAGLTKLTSSQINGLIEFLQKSVNASNDRLLLIGRASKVGNETSNHDNSRLRAENLIEKIKIKYSRNIKTDFVYFGYHAPKLTFEAADAMGISPSAFRNIDFDGATDPDFSLRLNQSIIVVPYSKDENPFELL